MTACETFPDGFNASTRDLSTSAFGTMQRPSIKVDFANLTDLSVKTEDVKELKPWWREMQIDYTATSLTKLDDRLPAISGIAKHFHKSRTGNITQDFGARVLKGSFYGIVLGLPMEPSLIIDQSLLGLLVGLGSQ
jgi:hypothetical protein